MLLGTERPRRVLKLSMSNLDKYYHNACIHTIAVNQDELAHDHILALSSRPAARTSTINVSLK